ncbi:MAG: hypothetical protein IKT38_01850 [Clostridia bacterium]|nr:hypothetical protein [Clostridia bacterium]
MAWGKCCGECIYCEYSPSWDKHLGKDGDYSSATGSPDYYCHYHEKWLGNAGGCCSNFREN